MRLQYKVWVFRKFHGQAGFLEHDAHAAIEVPKVSAAEELLAGGKLDRGLEQWIGLA